MPLFWSVERDGDTVVATCPEPIRFAGETRPEWMAQCAGAIRDELRHLQIADETLLVATLAGDAPLGDSLLSNVGIPQAQVQTGVRLRRAPRAAAGVVLTYRRAGIAAFDGDDGPPLAAVLVPITDGHEVETARAVWLATRDVLRAALPVHGGIDLRVRFVTGAARTRGSAELVKKLLDGVSASLRDEDDDGAEMGAADARIHAAEVMFVPGAAPQLEIELRAMPAG